LSKDGIVFRQLADGLLVVGLRLFLKQYRAGSGIRKLAGVVARTAESARAAEPRSQMLPEAGHALIAMLGKKLVDGCRSGFLAFDAKELDGPAGIFGEPEGTVARH